MKYLFNKFKGIISIVLLAIIFFKIDYSKIRIVFLEMNLYFFIVAVLVGFIRTSTGIFRLNYLLKKVFFRTDFLKVIEDSLIAGFYNLFFPTSLGGDIPKILMLSKHLKDKKKVTASVITERFIGFFLLVIFSFVAILNLNEDIKMKNSLFIIISILMLSFMLVVYVFNKNNFNNISFKKYKIIDKIVLTFEEIKQFNKKEISICFVYSLIYQALGILNVYFYGISLGLEISLILYFIFMPIIWFIIMIPISISGWGLREGAFVYFFSLAGVGNEKALMLSFLFYFQNLIIGIIGGILNLKIKNKLNIGGENETK